MGLCLIHYLFEALDFVLFLITLKILIMTKILIMVIMVLAEFFCWGCDVGNNDCD